MTCTFISNVTPSNLSFNNLTLINYYNTLYLFDQSFHTIQIFCSKGTLEKVNAKNMIVWFSNITLRCSNVETLTVVQGNVTLICSTVNSYTYVNGTVRNATNVNCYQICKLKKDINIVFPNVQFKVGEMKEINIIIKNTGDAVIKDLYLVFEHPDTIILFIYPSKEYTKIASNKILIKELKVGENITVKLLIKPLSSFGYLNVISYAEDPLRKTFYFKLNITGSATKVDRIKKLSIKETTLLDLLFSLIDRFFFRKV